MSFTLFLVMKDMAATGFIVDILLYNRIKFVGIFEVGGLILVVLSPKVYVDGNQIQAFTLSQALRQVRIELEWSYYMKT